MNTDSHGWRQLSFSSAVLLNPPVSLDRGATYPFVDMAAVDAGSRSVEATQRRAYSGGGSRFCVGDTVMARITPCLENGKIARYRGYDASEPAHGSTEFIVVRGRPEVTDAEFAYYLTCWEGVSGYAIGQMTGTSGRQRVAAESLKHLVVPVPPIGEQRDIVRILGTLDDKIELGRRLTKTLEDAMLTLFKSWFATSDQRAWTGKLAQYAWVNPESWSASNRPDSVAYVDLSSTKWGRIEKVEAYPWLDAPSRARRVLRPGDTIVGTVRPGNGSFALVGKEGLTASTGFAVLRPKEDYDAQFVWCAATSRCNIERLAHLADGAAYPAVSSDAVAATAVPPASAADRRAFSDATAPIVADYLRAYQESYTLAEVRDSLLPKLMSGEICTRDAGEIVGDAT